MNLPERLRKEAARANETIVVPGAECCYAPKWTCVDPTLLIEAADEIEQLEADYERVVEQHNNWRDRALNLTK